MIIFTDGGARGNPGPAAIGFVAMDDTNHELYKQGETIGFATNNVAEYTAVIKALEWMEKNAPMLQNNNSTNKRLNNFTTAQVQFRLDSLLVVNQLNGIFKIKDSTLRNLLVKIRELEQSVGGSINYTHIPREKNYIADSLVNAALDKEI